MITETFIKFLYEAAGMQRWNDHNRPHKGFTELDKQAHKMFYSYVLARFEESDKNVKVDWVRLIEGGIFEFFHRILLTDIKPPIYHKLMAEREKEMNTWVFRQLENKGVFDVNGDFREKLQNYLFDKNYAYTEKKILKASHYLATNWEFDIIYKLNPGFYGIEETKNRLENEIEEHYELAGVQKIYLGKKTKDFTNLVGQLRFQQRWAQSPRIPETSVMGHMLIVAILSYMFSCEIGSCPARARNNFYGGLFHDLPEVLTRDIISPVKNSIEGLGSIIKELEDRQMEENIYPLVPAEWKNELRYFTENEFSSKIISENRICITNSVDINNNYNYNSFNPIDGEIIEVCDKLSAYVEAYLSIKLGVSSHFLLDGHRQIYELFRNRKDAGIDFGPVFESFRQV